MRKWLSARQDGLKFAALFIFGAVLPMLCAVACGPNSDAPSHTDRAPVAQPYSTDGGGRTLVPLNLAELGDDCWFEVYGNGNVAPMCPPDYGWDAPGPVTEAPHVIQAEH
jgi:hypothetical protein